LKDSIKTIPRSQLKKAIDSLNQEEVAFLSYDWDLIARDKQLLPAGDWSTWLILAGRGWGKTRTGAETIRKWKEIYPIIHCVGPTAADVRDVIIEGESGLLAISPPWDFPNYEPSKRRITWNNGSYAVLFSADEPDRFRGPQCYAAWADELAAWRYPESWDQLLIGNRLGEKNPTLVTTTPRPTKIIKDLIKDKTTHVTRGTTYENRENLSGRFLQVILDKYQGTRIGRQELMAELLEDVEGALWTLAMIEQNRVNEHPELKRIVVAVDPAVSANKNSDETGILITGLGINNHGYVLDDASGIFTPNEWAQRSVFNYTKFNADRIVAEVNNGGDLVETNIRIVNSNVSYKSVHASRGKIIRAEPIVALYEQGKIHHVGRLDKLEDQMTTWDAQSSQSPDRVDALVWGFTELMLEPELQVVRPIGSRHRNR